MSNFRPAAPARVSHAPSLIRHSAARQGRRAAASARGLQSAIPGLNAATACTTTLQGIHAKVRTMRVLPVRMTPAGRAKAEQPGSCRGSPEADTVLAACRGWRDGSGARVVRCQPLRAGRCAGRQDRRAVPGPQGEALDRGGVVRHCQRNHPLQVRKPRTHAPQAHGRLLSFPADLSCPCSSLQSRPGMHCRATDMTQVARITLLGLSSWRGPLPVLPAISTRSQSGHSPPLQAHSCCCTTSF